MGSLPPDPSRGEFENRDQVREHVRRIARTYLDSANPNLRAQARDMLRVIDRLNAPPANGKVGEA